MKGQAAIEYLMTYGWAILLLTVAIAFLFASGIFSPSQFVKERCTFTPDLPCLSSQIISAENGITLKLRLKNDFGYPIKIHEIIFYTENLAVEGKEEWKLKVDKTMEQGETVDIVFTFRGNLKPKPGELEKIEATVFYYTCAPEINPTCLKDESFKHKIKGEIIAPILS